MVKSILIAGVVLLTSTAAMAVDLTSNLSLNTEVKAFHKVDGESNHITVEPTFDWKPMGEATTFSVGALITGYDSTLTGDNLVLFDVLDDGSHPDIKLEATHVLRSGLEAYGKTSYDLNTDSRNEVELGISWNF
tara:strand:+ start:288 stop:689 length:402 start_codon:yes stop_codon:yes gene_type:complete